MNKEQFKKQEHFSYEDVLDLVTYLRSDEGCPWDRVQTHQSVRRGVIEEAYEVAEAIDRQDDAMMIEELGDLLMQVLFHAEIARQEGRFTLQEVYDRLCKKLIFRHPNLFEGSEPMDWQELKRLEKGQKSLAEELDGIAKTLPALTRAEKIAGKLNERDQAQNLEKLGKRFAETPSEENLGKLLFAACAAAKQAKIDPEQALEKENRRKIAQNCSK
ncbi:MAG: nucleotide pyrophosphohydrolase [Clostridia bacterium]|nr:nucleotide pyrophosphohydrolase [Clostridia bacterium]